LDDKKPFGNPVKQKRIIACCRDFSTMLCALFRAKGIPARARCGFAAYLAMEGKYEDHWVCEVLEGSEWRMIDPQIDDFQLDSIQTWAKDHPKADPEYREILLALDPMNITSRDFMLAGRAWQLSRTNMVNPENFGIGLDPKENNSESLSGLWFIRGNLIRDFLALNKIELSPFASGIENRKDYWDKWRILVASDEQLTEEDWSLLDKMAELSLDADSNYQEIRNLFENTSSLHPPKEIFG